MYGSGYYFSIAERDMKINGMVKTVKFFIIWIGNRIVDSCLADDIPSIVHLTQIYLCQQHCQQHYYDDCETTGEMLARSFDDR